MLNIKTLGVINFEIMELTKFSDITLIKDSYETLTKALI